MTDILDRYLGCLMGLAIGDAVGTAVEFMPRGSFEPVRDMVGGGKFQLKPGEWTDDTSMALCLAESLTKRKDFDPVDQMERYLRWWKFGHLSSNGRCFDIGRTVRSALRKYKQTGEPYCGSTDPYSAGNGSIMRLAPVPMFYSKDALKAVHLSGESSKTTHGALTCIDACRYMGALLVGAINGESKEVLLSASYSPTPRVWEETPLCSEISRIADGSFKRKKSMEIRGSGYVVESLEAALWAFYNTFSYEDGCLLAVNLGDDADTTGAVYGQIAGAFYGCSEIRSDWRERIARRDVVEKFARLLYERGRIV
jgi:ADP-ribosyl-[dinitrogen reductase] hydrolase